MSRRKSDRSAADSSDVTSAGLPWSEVGDDVLYKVEWIDGRHGSAKEILPPIDQIPIPAVLFSLPHLHADRPRGSKAMLDAHGAAAPALGCLAPLRAGDGQNGLTGRLVGFHPR